MAGSEFTYVDPATVSPAAAAVIASAENLANRLEYHINEIQSIEVDRPQGGDSTGQAFDEGYYGSGGENPAQSAIDNATRLVTQLRDFGQALRDAVTQTEVTDASTADGLRGLE